MLRWIRVRLWPALRTSVRRWGSDGGSLHSAALAYYAAFSLFPLCLTLIAALGVVAKLSGKVQDRQQEMLHLVRQNLGPWLADQLEVVLEVVKGQATVGGTLGLLALMIGALAIFSQLAAMFDAVWQDCLKPVQSWRRAIWNVVYHRLVAFLMLLAAGALVVLLFVANMILSGLKFFDGHLPLSHTTWMTAQWLLVILGNAIVLTLIYKIIPRAPVRWRDAFCGGLLASAILQLGQYFLAMFVIGDHYSVYGVVGSFIAMMVWFYYASAVVFFGAEMVHSLGHEDRLRRRA